MTNLTKKHQLSHVFKVFDLLIKRSPTEATTVFLREEYDELLESAGLPIMPSPIVLSELEKISE